MLPEENYFEVDQRIEINPNQKEDNYSQIINFFNKQCENGLLSHVNLKGNISELEFIKDIVMK